MPKTSFRKNSDSPASSVIVGVVLATLVGRQKLSEIHRFISTRVVWG
ncbi:hypothetical protein [Bathymodiolus platifrons methanotrophic gill symbiont]|nr:hypothetical protein [Bathymodiolus platifrons methanotrophic gill symbiont]